MSTAPARRIVVSSPDAELGQRLATGVAALGMVEVLPGDDALLGPSTTALHVVHLADRQARARLRGAPAGGPIIAVSPGSDLAAIVEIMQASERIAAVVVAVDLRELAALASRTLAGDPCGLDGVVAVGTQIDEHRVVDHAEKLACLAQVVGLAERARVSGQTRASIEQCVDEMVTNALYDAPVDVRGRALFAGVSARARVALRSDHRVVVQYACDGARFAVAVRDAFGRLTRQTVLDHLAKGLHAAAPVEHKVGGAGLGLYLMANAATALSFHVTPGIATEVICVFELGAPTCALAQLGFVQGDPIGRRATGPARRLRAGPRAWGRPLIAVLAAVMVLVGAVAARRWIADGTPAAVATVELESRPPGAAAEVDGRALGSTPLTVTSLAPGAAVSIVFRRTGYRAATLRLVVPGAGERAHVVQPLELSDEMVRVRFVSRPAGAAIVESGQPPTTDRTYTPAELFVAADQVHRFTLTMPGHVPLVIEPFTPGRGAPVLDKGGDLVEGATLRIEASIDGKVTVAGAPHCQEVALPVDCTLAPGRYVLAYLGPDHAKISRTVTMATGASIERFELGIIEAGPGKHLQPGDARRLVVEAGTHAITVSDPNGSHRVTVTVRPGATIIVN